LLHFFQYFPYCYQLYSVAVSLSVSKVIMAIVSIIFPLIFMVALGYALTRAGVFNKEHIAGLSKFTFYVSILAFLFINMLVSPLAQSIDPFALLAFYLPVLLVFTIG
jgi:malonate transporter